MERFLNTHFMVSVQLVIVALVISAAALVVHNSKSVVRMHITDSIDHQVSLMSNLATLTGRNGADDITEKIITDCPRRNEFENLLGTLATLSHKQLLDVQQLFESCGGFYAERKALMISRLRREYEVLSDDVDLLHTLDPNNENDYALSDWGTLVEQEQKRSDLLNEQLTIQGEIITDLIAGKAVTSKEVSDLGQRGVQIASSLNELNQEIETLRSNLVE